jgi:hypothetical protein
MFSLRAGLGTLSPMTHGYGPLDWRPDGPDDDREPPGRHAPGPPRIPQPPPPAKHLGTARGAAPASPGAPYSSSPPPAPYSATPPSSTHCGDPTTPPLSPPPPPAPRRPNNASGQPRVYPSYPPPVPTSPTVAPRPTPASPRPGPAGSGGYGPGSGAGVSRGGAPGGPGWPARPWTGAPRSVAGGPTPTGLRPGGPSSAPGPNGGGPMMGPPRSAPTGRTGPATSTRTAAPIRPERRRIAPTPGHPRVRLSEAVPGLIKHLPHHKPWMVAISVIAVAVVLTTCGLGSYQLLRDDSKTVTADPAATAAKTRDISSRTTDPGQLTANDVFPGQTIVAAANVPPYKRIGGVQVETNCRLGATDDVGTLLLSLGCNQMVRATFLAPDNAHYVTAGVFNLLDQASATKAHDQLGTLLNASNRFTGYITTARTQVLGRAPTNLAFAVQGHFLLYTVIVRLDGKESAANDPQVSVIVYDLIERYLRDGVLVKWATVKDAAPTTPAAKSS